MSGALGAGRLVCDGVTTGVLVGSGGGGVSVGCAAGLAHAAIKTALISQA
jgi:hypothetical protein